MLTLPIKKKWFDMILFGPKIEEYREIKPYYTTRFKNAGLLDKSDIPTKQGGYIKLRNGYSIKSPTIICKCHIKIGSGLTEWGATPNVRYYILVIDDILAPENYFIKEERNL